MTMTRPARALPAACDARNVLEAVLAVLQAQADAGSQSEEEEEEAAEEPPTKVAEGIPIHVSHRLSCRGIWTWCTRCGRFTAGGKLSTLKLQCGLPTPGGKQVLAPVRKGRPPHYLHSQCGDEEA